MCLAALTVYSVIGRQYWSGDLAAGDGQDGQRESVVVGLARHPDIRGDGRLPVGAGRHEPELS